MVQGILEFTDKLGVDYYFVTVSKRKNQLLVQSLNKHCKLFNKQIYLTQIETICIKEEHATEILAFDYENEHYTFTEYGNGILSFLKTTILKRS